MKSYILKKIIPAATLVLLIISCTGDKRVADFNKEGIIQDIRLMLDSYHHDIANIGLMAEFKYLDDSPDFFWVPPGYLSALSYDSVRQILETNARGFTAIQFHWDTLSIFPISDKIANYSGITGGSMTDTSGVTSVVSIIESGTFIRRATGWKFLSGQSAVIEK